MSKEFWLGVLVTLIVGVPIAYGIAILANMHTPKVLAFLESRKLLKKYKTRQQALAVFNRIKAFHDGKEDKYAYYILLATCSVLSALVASVLLNLFFSRVADVPIAIDEAIMLLIATASILVSALLLTSIYETSRQLARFDDYRAEFEKQWGPVDNLPTPSS